MHHSSAIFVNTDLYNYESDFDFFQSASSPPSFSRLYKKRSRSFSPIQKFHKGRFTTMNDESQDVCLRKRQNDSTADAATINNNGSDVSNSSNGDGFVFKDASPSSSLTESVTVDSQQSCFLDSPQNTPPLDSMLLQNGAPMSSTESEKSSSKSSSKKKVNRLSLDQNLLASTNNNNGNGKESGLSKNHSKESIYSVASDQKSAGTSPSPKLQQKSEARKSTSTGASGSAQEKNVIQAAASQLKNFLAPNYKSRNEEFKRLFKVPESEKFIIDYSCAYQREILVHGRMYLSQNWMCFYANIFKWETTLTIPMKDITKISKERTAKVIPNAIQVCTKNAEKLFFTSFATRDKTHMVMFRLWQSSLLDQYEQPAELWAWAQHGYNEADLSESPEDVDEDGGSLLTDNSVGNKGCENGVCNKAGGSKGQSRGTKVEYNGIAQAASDDVEDSEIDLQTTSKRPSVSPVPPKKQKKRLKDGAITQKSPLLLNTPAVFPSLADNDDFSEETSGDECREVQCSCVKHEGKEMINEVFPVSVDQMFLLLFTDSVFYRQLQEFRKTTNLNLSDWHTDKGSGEKSRLVSYTVALNHSMGPKSCNVKEKQICAQCNKNGRVYVVKCECQNYDVPYSDTFYVVTSYCMSKVSSNQCRLRVHGGVAYRKSCWGIVKSFIEKNALVGIQDYFTDLSAQLRAECDRLGLTEQTDDLPGPKRKASAKVQRSTDGDSYQTTRTKKSGSIVFPLIPSEIENLTKAILLVLILMLLLNAMLFYKLWYFEAQSERLSFESTLYDLQKLLQKPELTSAEWLKLFHQERVIHKKQSTKWAENLQQTLSAVEQIELALKELRSHMNSIQNDFMNNLLYGFTVNREDSSVDEKEKSSPVKMSRDNSGL